MAVQSIEGVLTRAAAKRKGILVEVGVGRDSVGAGQSSEGEKERRRGDRVKGSSGKRQRSEEVQGWMKEKGRRGACILNRSRTRRGSKFPPPPPPTTTSSFFLLSQKTNSRHSGARGAAEGDSTYATASGRERGVSRRNRGVKDDSVGGDFTRGESPGTSTLEMLRRETVGSYLQEAQKKQLLNFEEKYNFDLKAGRPMRGKFKWDEGT